MQEHHEEHIDPDRIGRLGRGPRGGSPRAPTGGASGVPTHGHGRFGDQARPQRVIVKVHAPLHRTPKMGRDSVVRHLRYLSRENALRDPNVRFFDATRAQIDAKKETRTWAVDRHHFRVIVSPEHGQDIADHTAYVREVMSRVEKDLGKLQWLAINHSNTKNPHSHVLIRGRAEDGRDLVIPGQYVAQGIRKRASEVATKLLGERTTGEVKNALTNDVSAERWTGLDGAIERFAQPSQNRLEVDLRQVTLSRYATLTPELLAKRLEFLSQLGLAERSSPPHGVFPRRQRAWSVSPDFKQKLLELGARNDIIKYLYASLGNEAAKLAPQVQQLQSRQAGNDVPPTTVRGVVAAKGTVNELTDEQFLAVRDAAGKLYYVRTWASELTDTLKAGSVVDVGRGAHRRWNEIHEILRVASANQSLYSTGAHRLWLREHQPKLPAEQVERRLRSFARKLHLMTRQPASGVTRAEANSVRIDAPVLERTAAQRNRTPDVRILAAYPLKEQVEASAYTWLDRQIVRRQLGGELAPNDIVHAQNVRAAMDKRGEWLVHNGHAKRDEHGVPQLLPGAARRLRAEEQKNFAQECNSKHGKSVSFLREKDMLTGTYRGVVNLHAGVFAMIDTKQQLFAAPVSRDPRMVKGRLVTAKVVGPRHTQLEAATTRLLGLGR